MTLSMDNVLTHLNCRPEHGFFTSVVAFITGFLPDVIWSHHEQIVFVLQVISFGVGIIAGALTIYAKWKDFCKKRKAKKSKK